MSETEPVDAKWNRRYAEGDMPWDMGFPSRELTRVLDDGQIVGHTVLELGCGSGTNSVFLAERGFQVAGVDVAPLAIERARELADRKSVQVEWIVGDVCNLPRLGKTFDVIFDRGCYHCVRRDNLQGYLQTLEKCTHPGSQYVLLAGNANETREWGPPRVHEHELRAELEPLFEIMDLHPFQFDDPDAATGPLGWCCLMRRRG
jgi:SAM-dependent methyltransferase